MTVPGDWRVDRNSLSIFTTTTALAGLHYSVTSSDVAPSPQQLRLAPAPPAAERGYLTMPQPFKRLQPLAKRITAGQTSAYGKAVALQQWFTTPGNFTYSLTPCRRRKDAAALINFLTKTQARLLPAVRLRHGRAGPAGGHPVPRRRGLHPGQSTRETTPGR